MRASTAFCLGILSAIFLLVSSCEQGQCQNGCKISGGSCVCGYGYKTEYKYLTRRSCHDALSQISSNPCVRTPHLCHSGICIQTTADPGFSCKCDGTGFFGQRCEHVCPSSVVARGSVFPHECIVI